MRLPPKPVIMKLFMLLLCGVSLLTLVSGERCCDGLGCFQLDGAFKHLPAPSCASVKYGLFTQDSPGSAVIFDRSGQVPPMDTDKRVIFIVHGYQNSMETSSMTAIKDAFLEVEDAHVVILDWQQGASNIFYPSSAANTRTVGADLAVIMEALVKEQGHQPQNFWCVGYSLGAHACGFAGARTEIGRITGLDPAGPYFAAYTDEARLSKDDATLVDNIHTDGGGGIAYYGLLDPLGHIDYYPNRGYNQPGCFTQLPLRLEGSSFNNSLLYMDTDSEFDILMDGPSVSCSHGRAPRYFTQSILNTGCFVSREICTDERQLPSSCGPCEDAWCGMMGYAADQLPARGILYLETTSRSPYCRY